MDYKEFAGFVKKRAIELGANDVVASVVQDTSSQVKFSNSKISVTQTWDEVSMSIFLAIKQQIAMTSFKDFDRKKIEDTLKTLVSFCKKTKPNTDYYGIAKGPFTYKKIAGAYDPKIKTANQIDITEAAINKAIDSGARRVAGITEFSDRWYYVSTSGNAEAEDFSSLFHASVRSLVDKESGGHITASSRMLSTFDYLRGAEESGEIARECVNPKPGAAGTYDLLFHPLAIANLLSIAGNSASAFNVEAGLSFFGNQIGKKVGSDLVTFRDDPTIPNSIGSMAFDAEGVPSQNTVIIDKGVLKTYLHNTSTAHKYKTKTTANAGLIGPDARNLILEKGTYSKDEMIASIKNGIFVTNVWYTRFQNYTDGQFSTIPRDGAFLIENGGIKHAIKGVRISDNMLNILKNVAALGKEQKQILSWETDIPTATPFVLVKNVRITKPVEK